ncbi:MAG: hypothetical protein A2Y77_02015 [Planctomycetes bacterium RBG_13_62_9]|nr:MAG: hypothetical protein A2Y77_02015 [Planctomycetes bacterium RBG_13_62_9]
MAERATYHVVTGEGAGWNVTQENSGQVVGSHRTKTEAILQGRDLARTHEYCLLVVHDRQGGLEKQYTYGRHPRPSPASNSGE